MLALWFCVVSGIQLINGCVTPEVGRQIRDLESYKEERELFHNNVMKDSSEFFNIVFKQKNRIGVIFDKPSAMRLKLDSADGNKSVKYIPDTNTIDKCETEIFNKLIKGNIESKILVQPEYIIKNYDKYLRQYFGIINDTDTIIEIKASIYEGELSINNIFKEMDPWGGGARFWYADCYKSNGNLIIKDFGTNWIE